jgi:uncharacterized membrane protein
MRSNKSLLKKNFNFFLTFYIIYWFILIGYVIWIIKSPKILSIIGFIVSLGLQIFNTARIKSMKEKVDKEIKQEVINNLK